MSKEFKRLQIMLQCLIEQFVIPAGHLVLGKSASLVMICRWSQNEQKPLKCLGCVLKSILCGRPGSTIDT